MEYVDNEKKYKIYKKNLKVQIKKKMNKIILQKEKIQKKIFFIIHKKKLKIKKSSKKNILNIILKKSKKISKKIYVAYFEKITKWLKNVFIISKKI